MEEKRFNKIKTIKHYLFLTPALILLFAFMIYPSIRTFGMSFFKSTELRESETEAIVRSYIADEKEAYPMSTRLENIPHYRERIDKLAKEYGLDFYKDEIEPDMTLRELVELVTMKSISEGRKSKFAGLHQYIRLFQDRSVLIALRNNLLWLILFTAFTVGGGLLIAVIFERIPFSGLAKSILFMPMAISYVASAVIWAFMYDRDIGTINAAIRGIVWLVSMGRVEFEGIAFLGRPDTVNFALIAAGIWMWVGFCTVIFTAALRAIPIEIMESAVLDGANNVQIFFRIIIPTIMPTIIVVTTTMVINVLKIFDIVYTMTGGGPFGQSEVIANRLYRVAFNDGNEQYAAAMAVVLFIAVIPVVILNIYNLAREESIS